MNRFRSSLDVNSKTTTATSSTAAGLKGNTLIANVFDASQNALSSKQQATNALKQKEMCAMAAAVAAAQGSSNPSNSGKKKRTALGNISNAANDVAAGGNGIAKAEVSKKSRFGNVVSHLVAASTESKAAKKPVIATSSFAYKKTTSTATASNTQKELPSNTATTRRLKEQVKLISSRMTSKTTTTTTEVKKSCLKTSTQMSEHTSLASLASTSESSGVRVASTESLTRNLEMIELDTAITDASETESVSAESSSGIVSGSEEMWEDIDVDENDEFNANDYVEYIFKYYRQREDSFLVDDYITRQPHLNKQMRTLLVDWMVEVQQQLEFNHEVLYLSVKLMDLYLKNCKDVLKEKLQLLGGAAMFIACKFEERIAPIIDDFIYVSDNAYTREELIKMEIEVLQAVRYDIGAPLSYTFLRRYAKCLKADMRFLTLSRYILELSLQEYSFCTISDSMKACAALYLALKMSLAYDEGRSIDDTTQLIVTTANLTATEWNATLRHYTASEEAEFMSLVPLMNDLLKAAPQSKYKTIFKKYSHAVFYQVAKVAPLSDEAIARLIKQNDVNQQSFTMSAQ